MVPVENFTCSGRGSSTLVDIFFDRRDLLVCCFESGELSVDVTDGDRDTEVLGIISRLQRSRLVNRRIKGRDLQCH